MGVRRQLLEYRGQRVFATMVAICAAPINSTMVDRRLTIMLILLWAVNLPARAQFLCTVTHREHVGGNLYGYEFLTCSGNNCIVGAATSPDTANATGRRIFLHSHDGGHAWTVSEPQIGNAAILRIQQIDSLNIIATAGAESYFLLKSSDGGQTWAHLPIPSNSYVYPSFSSATHGMFVSFSGTFMTSDGGMHWDTISFPNGYLWSCHDYGNGTYRAYKLTTGEVYTTHDSWRSLDSTGPIISDPYERSQHRYEYCSFGGGDTIFAYGLHSGPCIARTVDGGKHWVSVFDDTSGNESGDVRFLSDISRDTILAGLGVSQRHVLRSSDKGVTWHIDSLECVDTDFVGYECHGVGLNNAGEIVGAYVGQAGQGFSNTIIVGRQSTASVRTEPANGSSLGLFPNPVLTSLHVRCSHPVHIFDMIGRDCLLSRNPEGDGVNLDVTSLPGGVYLISDGSSRTEFVKE